MKEDSDSGYELGVISCMLELWSFLIRTDLLSAAKNKSESEQELNIQKDMVSFIYQHYPEKISLTDIAAAGHVVRILQQPVMWEGVNAARYLNIICSSLLWIFSIPTD